MVRVSWAPDALHDLRFLQDYIGRDSKQAALRVARRVRADVKRLEVFPESGRIVPELGLPYREVIVGDYRVIYRFQPERGRVRILGVIHGSRLLPPFPDDD